VTYGREQVHTIIKNFPLGLGALMVYVVSVNFFYPVWGVGIGTVMSFVAATLYLIGFSFFFNWKRKKQAKVG
jgi:riboflavin transporter FmnP